MSYLQPGLFFVIVILLVAGVVRRGARRSPAITAIAIGLLFIWSWEPAAYLSMGSLEWWYPIRSEPVGDAEAIVVLAGGAHARSPAPPPDVANGDTLMRTRYAGWLHKNWRPLPIVVSGGETSEGIVVAEVMRQILLEQGVPDTMIWLDDRSHSTYENAVDTAELLRQKDIQQVVLVTEAFHMLRAQKAFEHQGLTVVPAPCDFRYVQFHGDWSQFVPTSKAIEKNENVLHEWLGLAWYWVSGKI
jgi:uncharacterized SAM-binding protein YcdF (DUF218 family)